MSYLKSKKFSKQSVAAMVSKAPYLLNFSVERLDNRLGFFQKQLGLSAEKVKWNYMYFFIEQKIITAYKYLLFVCLNQ